MKTNHPIPAMTLTLGLTLTAIAASTTPAQARTSFETGESAGGSARELRSVLQCVPYARDVTGIQIYGDAHTWWGQARGRYARGQAPRPGAVMAVRPHNNSRLGHVAAVSRVIDSRTILLKHANWSSPGQIEDNVQAVDVSANNDWSKVRIWHGPSQSLGTSHWPVAGFIYNDEPQQRTSKSRTSRSSDPIGDIIAGNYRK